MGKASFSMHSRPLWLGPVGKGRDSDPIQEQKVKVVILTAAGSAESGWRPPANSSYNSRGGMGRPGRGHCGAVPEQSRLLDGENRI